MEQVTAATGKRIAKIRELNDRLRTTGVGGMIVVTDGIASLRPEIGRAVHKGVAAFTAFEEDNDPYKEHDFGSVEVGGNTVFWKIDYYDRLMTAGSSDPADPQITCRVMTIMLAEEY